MLRNALIEAIVCAQPNVRALIIDVCMMHTLLYKTKLSSPQTL